jgi:hypothetical protein
MHVFAMLEQMTLQTICSISWLILTPVSMKSKRNLPFFEMTLDTFWNRFTADFSRAISLNETE